MIIEIKIPSPGESITEVEISNWLVQNGDYVERDQEVAEIESDKATLPLLAEKAGTIQIMVDAGKSITVGSVACTIDTSAKAPSGKIEKEKENPEKSKLVLIKEEPASKTEISKKVASESKSTEDDKTIEKVKATPLARKIMEANNLKVQDIVNGLQKITSKEVNYVIQNKSTRTAENKLSFSGSRDEKREKMSSLRRKLSQRLVSVKNETAMLTTFNEIDMSEVITLRKKYQEQFTKAHGVKLGYMSFFTKAVTEALHEFPRVNSQIDGEEIVTPDYVDVAIAMQTDKGLMVPVLRNTETMNLADMEKKIQELAGKARIFRLSIEEMTGGTFTITNGGVFGSMLSTPIINPPQSAILGMHNITERPMAIKGKVVIRPMMYVALSYDHRIIDGRDSVSFLVKVKELIESPLKMLIEGEDEERLLLGL